MARKSPPVTQEQVAVGPKVYVPEMVHAGLLSPAVYNPNKMGPKEYEALKESVREHGFVEPVVVQKLGMRIIGGHHRVRAIKELSIEAGAHIPEIPCIVLDIADADAKKLNLKLQHIHGDPDARLLGELLVDIYQTDTLDQPSVEMLGLDYDDALKYIRIAEPDFHIDQAPQPSAPPSGFARSVTLSLEFENVTTRDAVKRLLTERSEVQKKKSGDVVADLLAASGRRPKASKTSRASA